MDHINPLGEAHDSPTTEELFEKFHITFEIDVVGLRILEVALYIALQECMEFEGQMEEACGLVDAEFSNVVIPREEIENTLQWTREQFEKIRKETMKNQPNTDVH